MKFIRRANHYEYIIDAKYGEPIDCFFAFVRWDNAFWSVHRRHVMFQPDAWPETFDDYVSDILVTQWRETPLGHLEVCEQSVIGQGNDPRVTMVAGRPIALFRGAIHCEHEMYLYDFKAQKLTPVIVDEPMFSYGKNWMPFEFEGKLRAVHSLTPFHLLEIDIETGVGRTVLTAPQPFSPRAQHDNFAMLRGGGNPIQVGDVLLGLGHATMAPWKHYPYVWRSTQRGRIEVAFNHDFGSLEEAGFGIIDPTSLCDDGFGGYMVGVCASHRDWFYDQQFANLLVVAKLEHGLNGPTNIKISAIALFPPARQLIASETRCSVANTAVAYGARRVVEEGFCMFGPYERLVPGRYRALFRFQAEGENDLEAGWFDFCKCQPGYSISLVRVPFFGTKNAIRIVELELEWEPSPEDLFELRCYSFGCTPLIFHDVRLAGPL